MYVCVFICKRVHKGVISLRFTQEKARSQTLKASGGIEDLPSPKLIKLECWHCSWKPESPL